MKTIINSEESLLKVLPDTNKLYIFIVATEYQLLQAHLLAYAFKDIYVNKRYSLFILDDGRTTSKSIDNSLWSSITFVPFIPSKQYFSKIMGTIYKKCKRMYESLLPESVKKDRDAVVFFSNDEKIEFQLLLKLIPHNLVVHLEDGVGNYHQRSIPKYWYLRFLIKKFITNKILKSDLDLNFSLYSGQKKYELQCRSNPAFINDGTIIDLGTLFRRYAMKYYSSIKNNFSFENFQPQVLFFPSYKNPRDILKIQGCKAKKIIIKPHPSEINEFLNVFNNVVRNNENVRICTEKISAELLPFFMPSIEEIWLTYISTVWYTFKAFHKHIKIRFL